jgi:Family of unknown function (DUF5683)
VLNFLKRVSERVVQESGKRYERMQQRSTVFGIVFLITVPIWSSFAQQPAIAPAPTPVAVDSTRQPRPGSSATDTIPSTVRRNGVTVGTGAGTSDRSLSLEADTLRVTPKQEAMIRKIIPRKATLRSLMLPGLGQAYNRQYYKIPFIYAGYGALGYYFFRYRRLSIEAENGYRQLLYGRIVVPEQTVSSTPGVPASIAHTVVIPAQRGSVTEVVINESVFRSPTQAKAAYDFYRRYRDLNILLSVVLYAVSAVESNVAAHLKTFDLSDDISMRVEPTVLPMPGTGLVPGVRVALSF